MNAVERTWVPWAILFFGAGLLVLTGGLLELALRANTTNRTYWLVTAGVVGASGASLAWIGRRRVDRMRQSGLVPPVLAGPSMLKLAGVAGLIGMTQLAFALTIRGVEGNIAVVGAIVSLAASIVLAGASRRTNRHH